MVTYQFEYPERIRCAFIGAGGHSYRNVYPAFQYAPVDLVAVCDVDGDRASTYARSFGAPASYTDHREMLERERPDAVFVVTSYTGDGDVQATALAEDALRAGAHVWMEKPTASSLARLDALAAAATGAGRYVMTGLKKIFTPAVEKVKEILDSEEFGTPSSISVRYPQGLPAMPNRNDGRHMIGFLDHIYHPAAVLHHLMGPVERMSYEWEPRTGASVTSLRFASGAIGTLHLTAGSAVTSPLERVEVVGEGANVVVDNGVRLTYYRRGASLPYGRSASFVVDDDVAPLTWEPEFSLGQLYNKNLFYLGYVPEILHFCTAVLKGTPPTKGTLADVRLIMRLYEAYRRTEPGTVTTIER
ncbi:Gfo/Idh/MocA family protein [Jiangella asiatica]|uniref:Gfo/Idh/MocA family oxidoreductase n=1 Tax=Jiangella asiatica TaxID=2530372 RepID=A0A4R5CPZ2_9ACTN|nr:Gfo/Idh/MocA family oxidoreductase [Jiangella asiatica]TDE02549.1 Gfo/Idh/MocA family oxidoreductase [Jiangella asiatica]